MKAEIISMDRCAAQSKFRRRTITSLRFGGANLQCATALVVVALALSLAHSASALAAFAETTISSSSGGAFIVTCADIAGNGAPLDVVVALYANNHVVWFRNNGSGVFSGSLPVSNVALSNPSSVFGKDLNGDNKVDVLVSSKGASRVVWYRNNGSGIFAPMRVIASALNEPMCALAHDFDGDGDADVVVADFEDSYLLWYRNTGGGNFTGEIVISDDAGSPNWMTVRDLNGDGIPDLVVGADDYVGWYRNNGTGGFGSVFLISSLIYGTGIDTGDLDGDGDPDVVVASYTDNIVAWYRNNGTGWFSDELVITLLAAGAQSVSAADLENDGDIDVAVASYDDNKISWFNNNGTGGFLSQHVLTDAASGANSVVTYDLDSDGIVDIAYASEGDDTVGWFRNLPGYAIATKTTASITAANDGRYFAGFLSFLSVVTRDALNSPGAIASITSTFTGPAPSSGSAAQTTSGYDVLFTLQTPGSYSASIAVDGETGATLSFEVVPFSCKAGRRVDGIDCQLCETNSYQNENNFAGSICKLCVNNTSTHEASGSISIANCTCIAGFYTLGGAGSTCVACPQGATCAGQLQRPLPKPGYSQDAAADSFAQCPRLASCLGGSVGCAAGYTGYMCKDCQSGHYADANGECRLCPKGAGGLLAFYVLLLLALSIVSAAVVVITLTHSTGDDKGTVATSAARARRFPPSIPLVVSAFQIVGLISVANMSWPSGAQRALNIFNVFSLDVNLFASECSLSTFKAKYTVALLTPLIFAALVALELFLVRLARPSVALLSALPDVGLGAQLLAALFLVGPLAYLPVSRSTLTLFDCTRLPNRRYYLDADLSIECFAGNWWSLFPLSLMGMLLYIVATPAAIAVVMFINRRELFTSPHVLRAYGAVYKLFRRPYAFTPVALLGKKLSIAVCSLFFSRLQAFQFAGLLLIILGGGVAQMQIQPYYFPVYDRVELVFTILLSILLVCGMMMYSTGVDATSHAQLSDFVVVVVAGCIATLIVFAIYFIIRDIRGILKDRRARRSGEVPDNHSSAHAKRLRALTASSLRDIDNPNGFIDSLRLTRENVGNNARSVERLAAGLERGSIGMDELGDDVGTGM